MPRTERKKSASGICVGRRTVPCPIIIGTGGVAALEVEAQVIQLVEIIEAAA